MKNLDLGVTPPALGRPARLRADRIRRDTLTALALAFREDHDSSLRDKLDELIDVMGGNPSDAQIDDLVGDIEDLAGMGRAEMALSPADVEQLVDEGLHAAAIASGSVVPLPEQQNRRWSA